MTPNWEERENIFHEALALNGEQRNSFLLTACSENENQLSEIRSLIKAFESDSDFLEEPVFDMALGLFWKKNEAIPAGTNIGFYQIGKKIGEGGMGEVYEAFDTKLSRRVALKFLPESSNDDDSARRLLRREAQAVALLEHENICAVYNIEQLGKYHFIVMQFVEGMTLADLIERSPLNHKQILPIAKQIISAVDFAHSHGIIHRDLKPANIMLKNNEQIKVLDFGLAKNIQPVAGPPSEKKNTSFVSQNGLIIGTVAYMSPEQLRGENLDFRSDIFSIGIILYELMAGKNPFARNSQAETIAAILNEDIDPLANFNPAFYGKLPAIAQKCLQRSKARRFLSTAEILVEIESIPKRSVAKIVKATLAISLILLLAFAMIFFLPAKPKPSFAVLPIVNKSGYEDKQFIADGLTGELTETLSNVSGLNIKKVSDIKPLAQYPGQYTDIQRLGRDGNIDVVLFGSLNLRADSLFIETQIVRTSDGFILDSAEFPLKDFDLVSLRENISRRIADKLQFTLTEKEEKRLALTTTQNPEALRLYFLGRYHWDRRNEDDLKKAIRYFTEAADLEPSFVKAWTGLADVYSYYTVPGRSGSLSPGDASNLAKAALAKALQFDPGSKELNMSLGTIKQRIDWDWPGAEQDFRTAISIDSKSATAYLELSKVLMTTGRFDEALVEAEKAKDLDLFSISSHLNLGRIYYFKRDYEKAEQVYLDVLNKFPDKTRAFFLLGYLYLQTGKLKEATEYFEKVYSEKPLLAAAGLGYCYGKTGQKDKAQEVLKKLEDPGEKDYISSQEKAIIYLGLGDTDKAFEFLEGACEEKFPAFPGLLSDPLLDEIRLDPRFSHLKQCAHL
jgi:TolB-like protein/Tfp pilus assembly protein PilF